MRATLGNHAKPVQKIGHRNKTNAFATLVTEAAACRCCPRMSAKSAVLSTACGPIPADLMFIGEAPGRRGADRTGKPFEGDRSGDNLHRLLDSVGLDRDRIFITNAVLCCPEVNGRNTPPTLTETRNCAGYLERTIELVNPRVIATLGAVALRSICRLYDLKLSLAEAAGQVIAMGQRSLVPLYHPSGRVLHTHRNFQLQARDMRVVQRAVSS